MEVKKGTQGSRKDRAKQGEPLRRLISRLSQMIRKLGFNKDSKMFSCLCARQQTRDLISTEKCETVRTCCWDCGIFNFTRR